MGDGSEHKCSQSWSGCRCDRGGEAFQTLVELAIVHNDGREQLDHLIAIASQFENEPTIERGSDDGPRSCRVDALDAGDHPGAARFDEDARKADHEFLQRIGDELSLSLYPRGQLVVEPEVFQRC